MAHIESRRVRPSEDEVTATEQLTRVRSALVRTPEAKW